MPEFYEFFAGGGMARAGLGAGWTCLYANDFDEMKVATYEANWGEGDIHHSDINKVTTADLPGSPTLAWASFPCQDLSLAGNYAGIGAPEDEAQTRSGTFWAFWKLMLALQDEGRAPPLIVLENVYGVLTANCGRDFAAIGDCFAAAGYRFGALLVDAARFVPQSRPRVFIVAVESDRVVPSFVCSDGPEPMWHPKALV
jgi:DNA (cytosine-5)-methyltransferase 1